MEFPVTLLRGTHHIPNDVINPIGQEFVLRAAWHGGDKTEAKIDNRFRKRLRSFWIQFVRKIVKHHQMRGISAIGAL